MEERENKLAKLLGKRGKAIPMTFEIPTYPGKKLGLRPLTERDVEIAHARAIDHARSAGYFSGKDEESAETLAQVLGTKGGRDEAVRRSGLVGALAVIATSELGYAIQCEEVALSLCEPSDLRPLCLSSDDLRETLERSEIEWLAGKLEQWMRDRAPQRTHLTRAEIKELAAAAKKGQRPTVVWNSCGYSTLLDCVTTLVETLATSGSGTSSSSTPAGSAPAT